MIINDNGSIIIGNSTLVRMTLFAVLFAFMFFFIIMMVLVVGAAHHHRHNDIMIFGADTGAGAAPT